MSFARRASVSDDKMQVYHEKQVSSLCGVHALNNLLQGPIFGAGDLADIALELDRQEAALLSEAPTLGGVSHRMDPRTGDFSIEVGGIASALGVVASLMAPVLSGSRRFSREAWPKINQR